MVMPSILCTTVVGAAIGCGAGLGYQYYQRHVAPGVPALDPKAFVGFRLKENMMVSHNTRRLRFELPKGTNELGLPVASCLMTRMPSGLETSSSPGTSFISRPYTPVSTEEETRAQGYFDLVIKAYPGGAMSTYMTQLKAGDVVEMKGPFMKYDMSKHARPHIGMLAGGTGITPMLQVMHYVVEHLGQMPKGTRMSLIFANVSEQDILLKDELDALAKRYGPERLQVYYTLDQAPAGWTQGRGYVSEEMIRERLPKPSADTLIMVCGPDGFMKHLCGLKNPDRSQGPLSGLLKQLGYDASQVYKF